MRCLIDHRDNITVRGAQRRRVPLERRAIKLGLWLVLVQVLGKLTLRIADLCCRAMRDPLVERDAAEHVKRLAMRRVAQLDDLRVADRLFVGLGHWCLLSRARPTSRARSQRTERTYPYALHPLFRARLDGRSKAA